MKTKKTPRWALVLSGGGAKGIAHLGVLKALEAMGYPKPSLIVGTSMGAIVGGLYACGLSTQRLERFVTKEFDIRRYLDGLAFKMQNGPIARAFQTGQALGNLAARPGIYSGRKVLSLFEELTDNKTFDQTSIPFRCNAVDLITGDEIVLSSGSVARAMRASMAFPVFFDPVEEGDARLADGGIVNNLPVWIARELGFRRVLAVDVGSFRAVAPSSLKNGPLVIYRALEVAIEHIQRGDIDQATLTIQASDESSAFDFARGKSLVALGERAVEEQRGAIEAFFKPGPLARIGRLLGRGRKRELAIQERREGEQKGKGESRHASIE